MQEEIAEIEKIRRARDRVFTEEQIQRLLKLREMGCSYRDIADEMDVSRTTIMNYIQDFKKST